MRRQGAVDSADGLAPFGHLGWAYRDRGEFLARAAEYIADGLRQNQYIAYAGERSRAELRSELAGDAPSPWISRHRRPGGDTGSGVLHLPARHRCHRYRGGGGKIPEQAIANGYTGFRAVSDVTPLARTPEQRDTLTHLEFLVDRQMAVHPFSALCAYDLNALGTAAHELVCLHPFVGTGSVLFRLYADPGANLDFALSGELDTSTDKVFDIALQRLWPLMSGRTLRIGADGLEFISHRQLYLLDEGARAHKCKAVLSTSQPAVAQLIELLDLSHARLDGTSA